MTKYVSEGARRILVFSINTILSYEYYRLIPPATFFRTGCTMLRVKIQREIVTGNDRAYRDSSV
jgi:hypothetical protein